MCGKDISHKKGSKRKFCSESCFFESRKKFINKECRVCGKVFYPTADRIKYCSTECYNVVRKANIFKPCLICGEPVRDLRRGRKKYCSNSCRYNAKTLFIPNYNLIACEWFSKFDDLNSTVGIYANNPEEFYIKEASAYVDYINHDLKLIIEWYERGHYKYGKLREKDINRNQKIHLAFPNYLFLVILEFEDVSPFVLSNSDESTYKHLLYDVLPLTLK
jgi:hypothetical protein